MTGVAGGRGSCSPEKEVGSGCFISVGEDLGRKSVAVFVPCRRCCSLEELNVRDVRSFSFMNVGTMTESRKTVCTCMVVDLRTRSYV